MNRGVFANSSFIFTKSEVEGIQSHLLIWYSKSKRDLPWRRLEEAAKNKDEHAYGVWVSEIMLQQTRVDTVISYYNKWMKKWPSIDHLSKASQNEVNEVWSGLGYYSRAKRLREGAIKVVEKLDGHLPDNYQGLMKEIPGVGRYTACAIASIVHKEPVGVVDGNVVRVLCRLRTIGADSKSKQVVDHLWKLSDDLVSKQVPGNFNQAMMELGATVCLPKNPHCSKCPIQQHCLAYKQVTQHENDEKRRILNTSSQTNVKEIKKEIVKEEIEDIENCCDKLSYLKGERWIPAMGVTFYPQKSAKKSSHIQYCSVSFVRMKNSSKNQDDDLILLKQRPDSGLLAGLWEFPTIQISENCHKSLAEYIKLDKISDLNYSEIKNCNDKELTGLISSQDVTQRKYIGNVVHIFSHINMTYFIEVLEVRKNVPDLKDAKYKWIAAKELKNCAVSSSVHKIMKLVKSTELNIKDKNNNVNKRSGSKLKNAAKVRKLNKIDQYFAKK